MKYHYFISIIAMLQFSFAAQAQIPYNSAILNGYTKKATVSEQIGFTDVTITYHRPAVKGREGKIWGETVHKGFIDQGFGKGNPAPWRAGANENTTIEFTNEVKVEGKTIPKGKYGFFIAFDPVESTIIFSKRSDAWGSFFYDESEDVLRVKVKPQPLETLVENLKYEFTGQTANAAFITLLWERLAISFKVEVDLQKQQFEALLTESQNPRGFTSQGLIIAAKWTLDNNYELAKGLEWATTASNQKFPGDPTSFQALSIKAKILERLGRSEESATALKKALPLGSLSELQQFGRSLLNDKKPKNALEVFQFSYDKNPDQFISLVGMARGLSANGQYAKALEFAVKASASAPNEANKKAVEGMIEKLKAGKDIN